MSTLDELDEQAARLLTAIEQALAECNRGDAFAASVTLAVALARHKAKLVESSRPLATLWEDEPEQGE